MSNISKIVVISDSLDEIFNNDGLSFQTVSFVIPDFEYYETAFVHLKDNKEFLKIITEEFYYYDEDDLETQVEPEHIKDMNWNYGMELEIEPVKGSVFHIKLNFDFMNVHTIEGIK